MPGPKQWTWQNVKFPSLSQCLISLAAAGGSRKDRSFINSLWEEGCTHFFFFLLHGNLSTFSQPKSHGSRVPLSKRRRTHTKRERIKSCNCVVNLIWSMEPIKSNLEWIMPRMNYLYPWLCAELLCAGHLSRWHIHVLHHSGNDPT